MNIAIHSKTALATETVRVKKLVPVLVEQEIDEVRTVPATIGCLRVYPVQYRNYPTAIHIQHQGEERNRGYGFAFDTAGQATGDVTNRYLPSLASPSDALYANGTLTVNGTEAWLIGVGQYHYAIPMTDLPQGI